jgi:predicted small metal-binding protein
MTPEAPSELAERLVGHADKVHNAAARHMAEDMRLAARIIGHLQAGIREAVETAKDDDTRARLAKLVGGA